MKKVVVMIMIVSSLLLIGCATHVHTVGYGPQSGVKATARQYYLLWGLVPINTIDTNEMAGLDINGKQIENYEIQTQVGPLDVVINSVSFFTIGMILTSRTVTVTN